MKLIQIVLACAMLTGIAATASAQDGVALIEVPGRVTLAERSSVSATVTAIDPATRTIDLKGENGDTRQIVAGPGVRNFSQIKVGDVVVARLEEALTLKLRKGGDGIRERIVTGAATEAAKGAMPGGALGARTKIVANVFAIDRKNHIVTLRGVDGMAKLRVRDPAQLKLISVGDQIEATFTSAIGVSVLPKGR